MTPRLLPTLALVGTLATAGCQHPDGRTDWGSTLALGAGLGLAAGLVAAAAADDGPRDRQPGRRGGSYDGYGRSYAGGYGRDRGGWR